MSLAHRPLRTLAWLGSAAALLAIPATAQAHPENVKRHGGQWEILVGGTACMPGRVACNRRSDDIVVGHTRPSFGTGATLGWRAARWLMIGGAYRFGLFDPDYEVVDGPNYNVAYQHSAFFVFKPIIPIW